MGLLDLINEPEESIKKDVVNKDTYNGILCTLKGEIGVGARNVSLTQLGGLLRAVGLNKPVIEKLLVAVNGYHQLGLPEKEVLTIANSVSRYQPKPENRLPLSSDILTVEQASHKWYEQNKNGKVCEMGYTRLNDAIPFFSIGEVLVVAGRSGTCKTAFGIQISSNISKGLKTNCLFASLEMDSASVFFRMSNIELSKQTQNPCSAQTTAASLVQQGGALLQSVVRSNKHFLIVDKDSLTIEQIESYLTSARETANIDLLLIDYMGYIRDSEHGSNYEKVSRIAKGVKALAKRQQLRIVLLCQTTREGKDGTEPVLLHHLRDSGAIEESADYIIGLWHSGNEENRLHSEVLKCRNGRRGVKVDFINSGLYLVEEDYVEEKINKPKF